MGRSYDQIHALVKEEQRLVAAGLDEPALAGIAGALGGEYLAAYGAARHRLGIIRYLVHELSVAVVQVATAMETLAARQDDASGQT